MTNTIFCHFGSGSFDINKISIPGIMLVYIGSGYAVKWEKKGRQRTLFKFLDKFQAIQIK